MRWKLVPCVALCAALSAGCAVELGNVGAGLEQAGEGLEDAITEPGGLLDCPRAAWGLLQPSSWVLDGLWIGGEFVYREVLIEDALANPESPLVELELELAAVANNLELGFEVPDEIQDAAIEVDEWLTRQRSGTHEGAADIVGSDVAELLRGSSLEAALSCFDEVADRVGSAL